MMFIFCILYPDLQKLQNEDTLQRETELMFSPYPTGGRYKLKFLKHRIFIEKHLQSCIK